MSGKILNGPRDEPFHVWVLGFYDEVGNEKLNRMFEKLWKAYNIKLQRKRELIRRKDCYTIIIILSALEEFCQWREMSEDKGGEGEQGKLSILTFLTKMTANGICYGI